MTNEFIASRPPRPRPDNVPGRPWHLLRAHNIPGRPRHLLHHLTVAAVALAFPGSVHAQTPAYPAAEWRWAGTVTAGGTVEVRLVRGSVRAETIPGREATVILVRRGDRSDPATAQLSVDTAGIDFRIVDRYPAPSGTGPRGDCLPPLDARGDFWRSDVRLDAVVRIPPHVRLIVRVMDGDVDVRQLAGPRDVSTNQGAVLGAAYHP